MREKQPEQQDMLLSTNKISHDGVILHVPIRRFSYNHSLQLG